MSVNSQRSDLTGTQKEGLSITMNKQFSNVPLLSSPLSTLVSFFSIRVQLLSTDVYEGHVYVTANPNSVTSAESLSAGDKTNVLW
jgi:hypothetical protein